MHKFAVKKLVTSPGGGRALLIFPPKRKYALIEYYEPSPAYYTYYTRIKAQADALAARKGNLHPDPIHKPYRYHERVAYILMRTIADISVRIVKREGVHG